MKRSLIVAALVVGLVVAPAAAPVALATPAATAGDFTPSGNKPREYIISVLGSMLGKFTPKSWQREQIANEYKFNHSFEQIEVATGIRADATPGYLMTTDYMSNPQTKADYDLRQMELQMKGGKGGEKPLAPPITKKPSKFSKVAAGVGGAAVAMTGYSLGAQFGGGVVSLFGIDSRGEVCTGTGGWETLLSLATGVSCEGFNPDQYYEPNFDVTVTAPGWAEVPLLSGAWGGGGTGQIMVQEFGTTAPFGMLGSSTATAQGSISASIAGTCGNGGWSAPSVQVAVFEKRVSDGVIQGNGSVIVFGAGSQNGVYLGYPCEKTSATTDWSLGVPTGWVFDHLSVLYGTDVVKWYPEGHALWTPGTEADPDRTFLCSVTGSDGQVYEAETTTFKETGAWQAPVCPTLPDGVVPTGVKVDESTAGAPAQTVYDEVVDEGFGTWWEAYPECRSGACKLELKKVGGAVSVSCFDLGYECADWFVQADRDTAYQCTYGMHDVALSECYVYEGVFKKERLAVGAPYSDPDTGVWSGGQSSPTVGSNLMGSPVQDPELVRDCWAQGWAEFNPVEWVMQPIKCAWEWAMVPRQTVVNLAMVQAGSAWDETVFGQVGAILQPFGAIPIATGCTGWPIDIENTWPVPWGWHFVLGAACDGPMGTLATVIRTVSGGLIGFGGLYALSSYLGISLSFRGFGRHGAE